MSTTILVTGATGTIGSQVVSALGSASGVKVRAAVRKADQAKRLASANVEPVDFDYSNPDAIAKAVAGVDKIFLVTPFVSDPVELASTLIDAAKTAGVKHIVKLSAIGCDIEPGIVLGRLHRAIEKKIEASGIAYTFLRPNNFFENFFNYYGPDAQGNIYLPWGTASCSFMAGADIAAVASVALTAPGHEGKAYELTGPEAITIADAARAISEVTGRTIRYVDVPEEAAKSAMLGMQMPAWMVDAMMELHAIDKAGYASAVSENAEKLLGRKPMSFSAFAQKNASKWQIAK